MPVINIKKYIHQHGTSITGADDEAREFINNMGMDKVYALTIKEQTRSLKQNSSLHKYCDEMAKQMNDAGFDQRLTMRGFKEGFEIPWTMPSVKDLFRLIATAMYGVDSTAELDTKQIQNVYEIVHLRLSEITGISVAWPSIDEMRVESMAKDNE
jgi:hypothetical protein